MPELTHEKQGAAYAAPYGWLLVLALCAVSGRINDQHKVKHHEACELLYVFHTKGPRSPRIPNAREKRPSGSVEVQRNQ